VTYLILPLASSSYQEHNIRDMRVLHGVHCIDIQAPGVCFKRCERLIHPKGMSGVRVSVDDYPIWSGRRLVTVGNTYRNALAAGSEYDQ
jgi:hypothetical protein